MATEETSSGSSATPTPETPATGTASVSATPPKTSQKLEEALARIAELEHSLQNKTEQAERHGKTLTAKEKELAAYQEKERLAQEAALSEAQKLEKRATEAESQIQQLKQQLVMATVKLAASEDFINTELVASYVEKQLEFDETGMPSNLDTLLGNMRKQMPYLLKPKATQPAQVPVTPPAPPAQEAPPQQPSPPVQTPAIPPMAPGRERIQSPGTLPPNQVITLSQLQFKKP